MAAVQKQFIDRYWWSNEGLRLHYRDYPADPALQPQDAPPRPPIICIPGLTRNARDYEEVAARLAGQWRVICVDLRGRGDSAYARDPMSYVPLTYVQDMEALLVDQKIAHFIGFGTSLGGLITMLLASTRPGRVVGALLNDIGPQIEPEGLARIRDYVGQGRSFPTWLHAARALAEIQDSAFADFEISDWVKFSKKVMKLSPGGRIVYDYDMKIAEPFALPGGESGVDLWPALTGLKSSPTLILRGETSDLFSEATAARMMEMLPMARLVTVANRGHAPTLEEPEVTIAIADLLRSVESRLIVSQHETSH